MKLNKNSGVDNALIQEASRHASRGPQATLYHLLFPISLISSFAVFYLLPLLVSLYVVSAPFAEFIRAYLNWSVPVIALSSFFSYSWARKKILAPYIRSLINDTRPNE
ncbi:MAG TPA: hypothetical protein DEG76_02775 [Pseudohongiella sp.]|nr:hypothetical protein [Pseudohongiella sp.]HBX36274.1 hypothetical protein [Pseudohongiella sp.]|tara:strand:- start:766 stop:1089 length:324 start_codon:yes stop_codon:yes gene_type:complete